MKANMRKSQVVAAGVALAAATVYAGFEIDIDLAKTPIRDARQTTCASLIGYAGSFNSEKMGPIYGEVNISSYEGIQYRGDEVTVKIAPHTVQSVVIPTKAIPKPSSKK